MIEETRDIGSHNITIRDGSIDMIDNDSAYHGGYSISVEEWQSIKDAIDEMISNKAD